MIGLTMATFVVSVKASSCQEIFYIFLTQEVVVLLQTSSSF